MEALILIANGTVARGPSCIFRWPPVDPTQTTSYKKLPLSSPLSISNSQQFGMSSRIFAQLLFPTRSLLASLRSKCLLVRIGKRVFVSFPIYFVKTQSMFSGFSLIAVVSQKHKLKMLEDNIRKFSLALESEERRLNYVSEQITLIRDLVETKFGFSLDYDEICNKSSLASHIREFQEKITTSFDLTLNNYVHVSFSLQNPKGHPMHPIRPYHSMVYYFCFSDHSRT